MTGETLPIALPQLRKSLLRFRVVQEVQRTGHAHGLHWPFLCHSTHSIRFGGQELRRVDSLSSEWLAVLHFPSYPILIAGKHGVHHSVVEFAIRTLLQVICDGGFDAQCPLGLCFMVRLAKRN
jgi:hypothetical protein